MNFKLRVMTHELISGMSGGLILAVQGLFFLEKGTEPWQLGLLLGAAVVSTIPRFVISNVMSSGI